MKLHSRGIFTNAEGVQGGTDVKLDVNAKDDPFRKEFYSEVGFASRRKCFWSEEEAKPEKMPIKYNPKWSLQHLVKFGFLKHKFSANLKEVRTEIDHEKRFLKCWLELKFTYAPLIPSPIFESM